MTKHLLMLAGIALASACSPGAGERRAPASEDNLTRPLEVARVDTSQPIAPVEHQVTPPAEPKPKPATRKARRSPAKPAPAPAAASAPQQDTATVQGYAPASMPDSAPADTAIPPAADTAVRPVPIPCRIRSPQPSIPPRGLRWPIPLRQWPPSTRHHATPLLRWLRPHRLPLPLPLAPCRSGPRFTPPWMIRSTPAPTPSAAPSQHW